LSDMFDMKNLWVYFYEFCRETKNTILYS